MFKPLTILLTLAALTAGCTSHIVPLRPLTETEEWLPDASPTTTPATAPTATATTETATQPGHTITKTLNPNQTTRFVYKASYDNLWQQTTLLLAHTGFTLDRQDYRLGVITTQPLPSSQFLEFWKPQQTNANNAFENTLNNQRRLVRVTLSQAPEKPDFYEVAFQVLVERETNPSERIGGPIFVEGSGFGRNAITLQSDYAAPKSEPGGGGRWVTLGHDPDLERKLLDELFKRI